MATGLGYETWEDLIANSVETLTGSILVNDQGTEVEITGLDIDEVLDMIVIFQAAEIGTDDLGALRAHSGGDTWCCTASYKRGAIAIKYLKELRNWHLKEPRMWQEGYHI